MKPFSKRSTQNEKHLFRLVKGSTPVELTDSDPECFEAREILEGKNDYCWNYYDFGGSVYWNEDKTVAVIVWC